MGDKRSIFFDDWQACLRAHYVHVLRTHDAVTEPTLRQVLRQTGITDEELAMLQEQALGTPLPPDEAQLFSPPEPETLPVPPLVADDEAGGVIVTEADLDDRTDESPQIAPGQLSLF